MKKLLITGFEPFDNETINPSWDAVCRLPEEIGEYSLTKLLIPVIFGESMGFGESDITLLCKKLYIQDIDPEGFIDTGIDGKCYPDKDYHKMYVGEIVACYVED